MYDLTAYMVNLIALGYYSCVGISPHANSVTAVLEKHLVGVSLLMYQLLLHSFPVLYAFIELAQDYHLCPPQSGKGQYMHI